MQFKNRSRLASVRFQQRTDRALNWGTSGVLIGATLGCLILLANHVGAPVPKYPAWIVGSAVTLVAGLLGLLLPLPWDNTVTLIDHVYGLKDRTLTALSFTEREEPELIPLEVETRSVRSDHYRR
jgi:hypothetical protein